MKTESGTGLVLGLLILFLIMQGIQIEGLVKEIWDILLNISYFFIFR